MNQDTLVQFLLICLLLTANAFFVAAEFALVKLKSYKIDHQAKSGGSLALLVQHIYKRMEPYLAACQLGITMASLGLGWIGEPAVAALIGPLLTPFDLSEPIVHKISFATGFIIFSSLHIVIGEQVPKTYAIRKPEVVSNWIAYPLHWFYLLVYPLNWSLNASSAYILKLFGVQDATHGDVLSSDEIQGIIVTSEAQGTIESDKASMLHNLFEFDKVTVEEIMLPKVKVRFIDLQDPLEEQHATLKHIEHSRFPVLDGGDQNIKGILLVKDLFKFHFNNQSLPNLQEIVREPLVVPETQKIGKLFEIMKKRNHQMAIVIDEYASFSGIVTMEDLLEEIVGEIADELDVSSPLSKIEETDGNWHVNGWTQLGDLERSLGVEFSSKIDANTVAGLFMYRLSRVPKEGDIIVENGFEFKVISMEERHVNIVNIQKHSSFPG